MKIGDRVFVRGYIDEIRKDTVIIRNAGGYFGTIPSEVITGELPSAQQDCTECEEYDHERHYCPNFCDVIRKTADELQVEASCKLPERKTGRWYDVGSLSCRCSACGCKSQKEFSFCPNCGADMREGEVDEAD